MAYHVCQLRNNAGKEYWISGDHKHKSVVAYSIMPWSYKRKRHSAKLCLDIYETDLLPYVWIVVKIYLLWEVEIEQVIFYHLSLKAADPNKFC